MPTTRIRPPVAVTNGLSITSRRDDDSIVIELAGELELANAAAVNDELRRACATDCRRIVLDLRRLEFLDSTGIHAFVQSHKRCVEDGRAISLLLTPGPVLRILEVCGMLRLLDHTTEEALAA